MEINPEIAAIQTVTIFTKVVTIAAGKVVQTLRRKAQINPDTLLISAATAVTRAGIISAILKLLSNSV